MKAVECSGPGCRNRFTPRQATQRFCSATCRQRATRDRKAAAAAAKVDAEVAEDGKAEHELVRVTRAELEKAGVLDTVDGQIALQLARRAVEANASGVSSLMRELRVSIAAAKGAAPTPEPRSSDPEPPTEPPTKLEEARARRESKARQAADRA